MNKTSTKLNDISSTNQKSDGGLIYGLAAYASWVFVPLYYKLITQIMPTEILAHRILWSPLLCVPLAIMYKEWNAVKDVFSKPKTALLFLLTASLLAINWGVFIWAVANNELVSASFGYFINPLLNVLLGMIFLKERLRLWQAVSVVIAVIAVVVLTVSYGKLPVISLVLAGSFGFYALIRKTAPVSSLAGLTVETLVLAPFSMVYLGFLMAHGQSDFLKGNWIADLLLLGTAVITVMPLLWFAKAARRMTMTALGFLQYVSPTGQLLVAVLIFGEKMSRIKLVCFGMIWFALLIFSVEALMYIRRAKLAE